jgi:N-acetylglucosamine-6-phosphate deacetylase
MADGSRYRMGEIECIVDDGVRMTLDRSAFAKSIPFVSALIPIVISALEISLVEAVVMATSIPAKAARLCDVGRIWKGFERILLCSTLTWQSAPWLYRGSGSRCAQSEYRESRFWIKSSSSWT